MCVCMGSDARGVNCFVFNGVIVFYVRMVWKRPVQERRQCVLLRNVGSNNDERGNGYGELTFSCFCGIYYLESFHPHRI